MSEDTKPFVEETASVEKRLWRLMLASLAAEIIICLFLAKWEFTAGVIIGGSLAIINFRLLQNSIRGIFQTQSPASVLKFFLRYLVIGLVILIFNYLELVPIIAILIGISSFIIALMIEALVQFYFVITNHEEI